MTLIYESGPELQWTKVSELVVGKCIQYLVFRQILDLSKVLTIIIIIMSCDRAYFQQLKNVKTTKIGHFSSYWLSKLPPPSIGRVRLTREGSSEVDNQSTVLSLSVLPSHHYEAEDRCVL